MSDGFVHARRLITVTSSLGDDVLLAESLDAEEAVSRPFAFTLTAVSLREDLKAADLVGLPVTLTLDTGHGERRYLNGLVRRLTGGAPISRDYRRYTLHIAPWFSFLGYTRDHRIFQNKTVPDIVKEIFGDFQYDHFDTKGLSGSYPEREYCVQYGESYFDFVSRLLEEEGIFYYFTHENGRHTMVLGDGPRAWGKCAESKIKFAANRALDQSIHTWEHGYGYLAGKTTRKDYNFETPQEPLVAEAPSRLDLAGMNRLERFEYPGRFLLKPDGDTIAEHGMEAEEAGHETAAGASDCKTMFAGGTFTLERHDCVSEQGTGWALLHVTHRASNAPFHSGMGGIEHYANEFVAIPDRTVFRPERWTPKPRIDGVQTAFVVGPKGEEIYTDKYGRVKVQFHWDRRGGKDEKSSCWVRTAQAWAGRSWGAMVLPRVGMEVVVSFLDGDPDRPLVTGHVNNAENTPVYALPDEKTKTSLKTRSTPGGKGFNELRFEDKKGKEQIFVHAERDLHTRTKREQREWTGADRHEFTGGSRFVKVDKSLHSLIKGDRLEKIDGGLSLDVAMDVQEKVGTNFVHKSGMNLVMEAGMSISLKVGGNFIAINPAGVFIQGNLVLINSGGSAVGMSASPEKPEEAQPAVDAKPGEVEKPTPPPKLPVLPAYRSPTVMAQVATLENAASSGTPFCEICAAAAEGR